MNFALRISPILSLLLLSFIGLQTQAASTCPDGVDLSKAIVHTDSYGTDVSAEAGLRWQIYGVTSVEICQMRGNGMVILSTKFDVQPPVTILELFPNGKLN